MTKVTRAKKALNAVAKIGKEQRKKGGDGLIGS
jgi:hypothetical protein